MGRSPGDRACTVALLADGIFLVYKKTRGVANADGCPLFPFQESKIRKEGGTSCGPIDEQDVLDMQWILYIGEIHIFSFSPTKLSKKFGSIESEGGRVGEGRNPISLYSSLTSNQNVPHGMGAVYNCTLRIPS